MHWRTYRASIYSSFLRIKWRHRKCNVIQYFNWAKPSAWFVLRVWSCNGRLPNPVSGPGVLWWGWHGWDWCPHPRVSQSDDPRGSREQYVSCCVIYKQHIFVFFFGRMLEFSIACYRYYYYIPLSHAIGVFLCMMNI